MWGLKVAHKQQYRSNVLNGSLSVICMALALVVSGCGGESKTESASSSGKDGKKLDKVVLLLNWYPEAEHGGFYAAKVHGIYEQYGLDVEIRPGAENIPVAQEMALGRVQFGIGNADDVLLFRNAKADIVSLLAPIQLTPRCIMVRENSGIENLSQLKGLTLQANDAQSFMQFMKQRGMLDGVQVIPYSGSVARFVADEKTAVQAYSFSEPLVAEQQGVKSKTLMLSNIGFNPYASCLMATRSYATEQADIVKRMTLASKAGWQKYLSDAKETNAYIHSLNKDNMTTEALAFGAEKLKPLCLPDGMAESELGTMTAERWKQLVDQFVELKLVDPAVVKAEETFLPVPQAETK
ncbi:MAG: ABC transporter substrate-binding protein [Pirellulales bacterium]